MSESKKLDLGRMYRLLGVLEALASALPPPGEEVPPDDGVPTIGKLKRAYILLKDALDELRLKELYVLVGVKWFEADESGKQHDPGSWAARSTAATMVGFLRGCVAELEAEAQRHANAEAYAAAKVREERRVGFQTR